MDHPNDQDPQTLVDVLTAVRDAAGRCHPLLADTSPAAVAAMLDTATATSEITVLLLRKSVPPADTKEPGTGEALERATDLAGDAFFHLGMGLHLMAGARAIAASVAESQ